MKTATMIQTATGVFKLTWVGAFNAFTGAYDIETSHHSCRRHAEIRALEEGLIIDDQGIETSGVVAVSAAVQSVFDSVMDIAASMPLGPRCAHPPTTA